MSRLIFLSQNVQDMFWIFGGKIKFGLGQEKSCSKWKHSHVWTSKCLDNSKCPRKRTEVLLENLGNQPAVLRTLEKVAQDTTMVKGFVNVA
jgi:hypothetical protein